LRSTYQPSDHIGFGQVLGSFLSKALGFQVVMADIVDSSFGYLSFVTDLTDCMMRSMLSTAQLLLSVSFSCLPQTILFTPSEYSHPDCL